MEHVLWHCSHHGGDQLRRCFRSPHRSPLMRRAAVDGHALWCDSVTMCRRTGAGQQLRGAPERILVNNVWCMYYVVSSVEFRRDRYNYWRTCMRCVFLGEYCSLREIGAEHQFVLVTSCALVVLYRTSIITPRYGAEKWSG